LELTSKGLSPENAVSCINKVFENTQIPEEITEIFNLAQKFWNGHIPYLDFYFEYPPLSIILFILPLFFTKYFVFYIFFFFLL